MTEQAPSNSTATNLLVAFARLEGKVDLTLTEITALKGTDADHEIRIRSIEQKPVPDEETDRRLRELENRRTVSPAQLWTGMVGVLGVLGTVLVIVDRIRVIVGG